MECSEHILSRIDFAFDWHLTDFCNFRCDYCFPSISQRKNRKPDKRFELYRVLAAFDSLPGRVLVNMSGGEPFLYPRFLDLCEGLTQSHFLGINTNLSTRSVVDFAERIQPSSVSYIWAALHIEERLRRANGMEHFITRFMTLQHQGFPITAIYVIHPRLLDRFEEDIEFLHRRGVKRVGVKVFKGVHDGRTYPKMYNEGDRERILRASTVYRHNRSYIAGERVFRGHSCTAGKRFFKIEVDGTAQRCASDATTYGNIFEGTFEPESTAKPCRAVEVLSLSQCHELVRLSDLEVLN